jgi:membrane-associated phospholipid phosphatase
MDFLHMLEKIRNPIVDNLMLAVTSFGEETALLVIALIVFWCVNKRHGYYIMSVGFIGSITNQFMKLSFRIPRPWVRDPSLTAVEGAVEGAGGYSFPSGHTQTAVGLLGAVAVTTRRHWLCGISMLGAVLVGFSRMYLGVHTPEDVLVGAVQSVLLLLILYPLIYGQEGKRIPWVLGTQILLAAAYLVYVELLDPAGLDAHNYESGLKNAYTFIGCTIGLLVVWFADRKLNFSTDALWWGQLLKVGLGLLVVLAVKEGMRIPLEALCGGHMIARAIRYFLIVVVAGVIWPLTFRFVPKENS